MEATPVVEVPIIVDADILIGMDIKQRCRRREGREWDADMNGEEHQDTVRRSSASGRPPLGAWGNRHKCQRAQQQSNVESHLTAWRQSITRFVRVRVSHQKANLVEEHARRPDSWPASVPGKNLLRHERLHLEEQECAQEDRCGVKRHAAESLIDGPA